MLVRVGSLGCVTKRCEHCGRIFFTPHPVAHHCSAKCRRDFQNERRKRERLERALSVFGTGECPVCGKEFRRKYEWHFYCSRRCCYKGERQGITLEQLVKPMTDPWTTGRLPEEVTENALNDGGMAMPQEVDLIEYYRLKIASLYNAGRPKDATAQKAEPSPAKPEEQEGR